MDEDRKLRVQEITFTLGGLFIAGLGAGISWVAATAPVSGGTAIAAVSGVSAGVIGAILLRGLKSSLKLLKLDDRVEELRQVAQARPSVWEATRAVLEGAGVSQRKLLVVSQSRLDTLFVLEVLLIIAAVTAPFVLVLLYARADSVEVIRRLSALKAGLGSAELAKLGARDWHLLLGGVSFGLLFLAAARGVTQANERQRQTYFRVSETIRFYEDLGSYLTLEERLAKADDGANEKARMHAAIGQVQRLFLPNERMRSIEMPVDEEKSDNDDVRTELIKELLKQLSEPLKK